MSNKLRTEKNCLNCGSVVEERFCSHCGQENIETKENFFHQLGHVIGDITHFDSKFFRTIVYLFTKPGFITLEYLKGKRISYVHPVRLFVFTSFLFFLALGFLSVKKENFNINVNPDKIKNGIHIDPSTTSNELKIDSADLDIIDRYKTVEEYLQKQDSLPVKERDGYLTRKLITSTIEKRTATKTLGLESVIETNKESFLHKMHYGILILLPFFALLLKLLFRKSKLFYSEHLIFSFHVHTFLLLLWIFSLLTDFIFNADSLKIFFYTFLIYLVIALKKLHGEGIGKTLLKTVLLFLSYTIFVVMFFAVVMVYTYLFS